MLQKMEGPEQMGTTQGCVFKLFQCRILHGTSLPHGVTANSSSCSASIASTTIDVTVASYRRTCSFNPCLHAFRCAELRLRLFAQGHVAENRRPRANGNNPRAVSSNYFNAEFFMVLLCLTVSLLILPLVLPPSPLMWLLLPIGVLVLLILAFMPSDVRNIASTCNETYRYVPYEMH